MRVVAGKLRGRALATPDDGAIRPTSDRVREAVFNILAHGTDGFSIEGVRVSLREQRITLRNDCPSDLGQVCVDRVQLESVIHQLLQNAVESIVGADAATRTIGIRAWRERASIVVTVSDSGPGIDPNLGDAIFSPFKTTKPLGTGLGLSIGRTIVEDHGGSLSCSSSEAGATFQLVLPVAEPEEEKG